MIEKCANPNCSTEFLYTSQGRIFSYDPPAVPNHGVVASKTTFFWLCETCSHHLTLKFIPESGLHMVDIDSESPPEAARRLRSEEDYSAQHSCPNCVVLALANE